MDKRIVLISAVSGDIGYSAVRSVDKGEYRIIGCDMRTSSPVMDLMDRFYRAPAVSDVEHYIGFLKMIIEKENVEFFLPISEPEIEAVNSRREELSAIGAKLLLNNKFIIDTFLDKLKSIRYLESIGIRVPKTVLLKEYHGETFRFPVIVKARKGYGSRQLWKVDDQKDLECIRRKDGESLIVQEYIGSAEEEYTTGVFSDGENNISSISFKRRLGVDGTTLEANLVKEAFLDELSVQIAKHIGLRGSLNIQSRRVNDIFIPFEINPRISGTLLFRKKFGFDDIKWWIDVLLGKRYSYRPLYKSGKAIRYYSEHYFDMEAIEFSG